MKTDLFFNRLGFNPDLTTRQSRVDSVSIASRYRVLATLLLCLTLFVGSGNAWGAAATVYTSNVTLSSTTKDGSTSSSKATNSTASISSTSYKAVKLGSSGNSGYFFISVPANTTTLTLHAAGWNGKSNKITLSKGSSAASGVSISPSTAQNLTANSGVSGNNTTYTITPDNSKEFFTFTLSGVSAATIIKIYCSERCLVWGVNAETTTPCMEPTSVSITGTNKYLGGQTISLKAAPTGGTGTPSYQWQKKINGTWTNLSNGTVSGVTTSGATSNNLQISSCGYGNSGGYRCIVSTGEGCETKSHADGMDGYGVHVFSIHGKYIDADYSDTEIIWTSGTTGKATIHMDAKKTYLFKVWSNNGYYYGHGVNANEDFMFQPTTWDCGVDNREMRLFTTVEGDYTFTVNIEHGLDGSPYVNLQVDYPSMTHPNTGYVYVQKFSWRPYLHYWYNKDNLLSVWGSDPQLNADQYTNICGTEYWCVPVIDYYCNFIAKDAAGDPSNTTGDQHTNSPHPGQRLYNDGSWKWGSFSTYTITYEGGGGTGGPMAPNTGICLGSSQQLTANAFSKAYHTFNGWSDGNGHTYANQATITNIQSNINLTAQWAANSYTVTTNLNNVTPNSAFPASVTYTGTTTTALNRTLTVNTTNFSLPSSITVTMGGATLTKGTDYTWSVTNGVGSFTLTKVITGNVAITITALPMVTWMAGGSVFSTQTNYAGTALTDPGTPSPATYCPGGKVFVGWSANTIAGTSNTQPTDLFTDATKKKIPAGGITYYAVYATSTGSSSTSYAAITSGLASGNYVIAYEYSNNGTRIALQNIADNSDASNKMEAYALARDGSGKYANPSDTYIWQLQAQDGGGYYIYDLATGMYLNATTSALQLSTTPTKYNIAYDGTNSRWKIQLNSSSSYYVHGYTGTYTDFRVSTSGSGVNYRVYLYKNEGTQTFSAYATTCCENIIALTAGATDATTHCTSLTFSNDNLPTCSDEPTDRRVTITVTPYDGYAAPAKLTPSGDGTATYVSGPTGSGPYTYEYEFDKDDDGDGTFTATCTPKAISLVLDKNNSDVSGSADGSATVYFDATSLSTISHATRSGYVLDGYYAEPGCTNKVLTDAGALVNCTGYVVSGKWARATTPTTLYAKWIAKSFEDYKFTCADLSLTDEEEGTPKTPIWITTSAGQIVRSQKALHIEGTGLKPSSTFTFTIGGVDANDCSGTGEHDLFAIRQANYSAVATDTSGNIDMDVYVFYNPTGATDGLDQPGSTIVATSASGTVAGKEYMSLSVTLSTTSVNGRHLPNQFVMAARIGKTWYALPGNITTKATQDPVMIGVDNATNPTIAYCPAAYGFRIVSLASTQANPNGNTANNAVDSRGFYTDGEKIKLRLQNDAPMFGSTGTSIGKSDATNWWGGGKNYFWTLEHQNTAASNINAVTYNIRTANTNSNPLIRLNRGQWKWGLYANGVEEIRLLSISPVQDLTLEVMEWGTNEIAVQYSGSGSLTNVKIGDSEEGATMSTICGDIKRISGLSSLVAGASGKQGQQMLIQITESEVLKQKIVQVPFIVNSTDVTTDSLRTWTDGATTAEQDSITYNMEIVVRPGAKITTNNGSGKFGKLSIYPGGVADISNAIRLAHFTMRGGYSWLGGAFAMPHAKVTGNVTGTGNRVVYDYYIDATKYYDLAVPKTMTWLPVTDETGNEDFTFWVKWYNGATRASTGKGWTWYDWSGAASSWRINMGQGYLVAAQPPIGRNYFIMRFPMSITLASDESTKDPIAVTAHGMTAGNLNPGVSANNAGWNLIANPFLTSYINDADGVDGGGNAINGSIAIGELVPEIKEGNPTGKYVWDATGAKNIRYVTTYDYATATYEQHPMSSTVLEPFTGFFIQVAKDCYVRFDASGRQNNIIRRRVESLPDDMEIGITASSDEESDETILLLCDDLSRDNALEFPDESSKLINTGHLNFYTFAGATSMYANGMSYAEGQEWNAAGITPTKSGVYSFTVTKVNTSYVEGVLLKDLVADVEYDLLKDNVDIHLDPGTIDDRFLVKIVLKNEEETPTALDEITEGSINQRPEKIIYNDKLYIRYNGVLYDATGKRVREVNK